MQMPTPAPLLRVELVRYVEKYSWTNARIPLLINAFFLSLLALFLSQERDFPGVLLVAVGILGFCGVIVGVVVVVRSMSLHTWLRVEADHVVVECSDGSITADAYLPQVYVEHGAYQTAYLWGTMIPTLNLRFPNSPMLRIGCSGAPVSPRSGPDGTRPTFLVGAAEWGMLMSAFRF